jgi:hypothetical protein
MNVRLPLCLVIPLVLGACTFGVPVGERDGVKPTKAASTKKSKLGNPSSYVVHGKRYYVLRDQVSRAQDLQRRDL